MNCKDMMQIPELTEVLKLKAGENGLQKSVRWIYFADCLQCVKSEYKIENYIHGDEVLTNPSVTDDSKKLMALIHQMYEYRITALGINEGQISEELIEYCEEKNLPLFELPEKYPLIDLSQIICRKLVLEENDRNAAEQLFSSILDAEHLSRERVMAQARYLNIDLEGSFFVAEIAFTSKKAESGWEDEDFLAAGRNVKRMIRAEFSNFIKQDILILPQAGSILALIPDREETESCIKEIFSRIVDRAQREYGMDLRIGVGNSRAYLDEVKNSRNEASAALRAAEVSGLKGNIFFYRDQGIYTLLSHVDDTRILDTYVEEKFGKLLQADELNDGKLSETLENYLNCSCNAKKTAEEMFLHRNTLNYRLKKIREILGCDLEKLDTCLELKLAFLIWRYRYRG